MHPTVVICGRRSAYYILFLQSVLLLGVFLQTGNSAWAQPDFTRIYGPQDQSIPMPKSVGSLGRQDASALQELIDYLKAIKLAAWQGMRCTGALTDASGSISQAILTVMDGDHFRLDVNTSAGQRSTRIDGTSGKRLEADGKTFAIPPGTAKAGIIAFPQLLASGFPQANTGFTDRGQIQIDGMVLHRITLEEAASAAQTTIGPNEVSVTDLYFDPSTHLLLKSASAVQIDPADRERYLIVTTYGDYRPIEGHLLPHQYRQTLNGQPQWSFQVNNAELSPAVDTSFFHF